MDHNSQLSNKRQTTSAEIVLPFHIHMGNLLEF